MILMIDNFDSFTYNIVHLLESLGADLKVVRNDAIDAAGVLALAPKAIVLSPGPGRPQEAGNLCEIIRALAGKVPMLGVCLGHQAIAHVFGAKIVRAKEIRHGKVSPVTHDGRGVFAGLPSPIKVVRYHSLAVDEKTLPAGFEVSARTPDGEIMGLRNAALRLEGVQFHPESILTPTGKAQLANFLKSAND